MKAIANSFKLSKSLGQMYRINQLTQLNSIRTFSGGNWHPSQDTNFTPSGAAKGQSGGGAKSRMSRNVLDNYN